MINILFPFEKTGKRLKQYWWHRMAQVIFGAFFVMSILIILSSTLRYAQDWRCLDDYCFNYSNPKKTYINQPIAGFLSLPVFYMIIFYISSFIAFYIFLLLIQLFYYKIFIYIVLGDKLKK